MTNLDDRLPRYEFQRPRPAPAGKKTYAVRPPVDQRERFAQMINDIMRAYGLRTQNAALCAAVELAHEQLDSYEQSTGESTQ